MESVKINNNIFYNGDCISGSKQFLKSNSIDLIITDPPYGINGDQLHQHYNRKENFVVEGYVEIPEEEYAEFSVNWITEAERVLKPGGSIYIVSGYTNLIHILNALNQTGLEEINHIIWKYNFGVFTKRKFVSSHYHILYYEKPGSRRKFNLESRFGCSEKTNDNGSLNYQDREDVWIINREYKPGQIKNKNELPYALLTKMLQYSSDEGDLVCDFFLGGFSTAISAIGLNRKATGFEISKEMFDTRIEKVKETQPGYLIPSLRSATISLIENQGKSWTDDDYEILVDEYIKMRMKNIAKKDIIAQLGEKFGRGRWAIEKALKRMESEIVKKSSIPTLKDFN